MLFCHQNNQISIYQFMPLQGVNILYQFIAKFKRGSKVSHQHSKLSLGQIMHLDHSDYQNESSNHFSDYFPQKTVHYRAGYQGNFPQENLDLTQLKVLSLYLYSSGEFFPYHLKACLYGFTLSSGTYTFFAHLILSQFKVLSKSSVMLKTEQTNFPIYTVLVRLEIAELAIASQWQLAS